MSSTKIYNGNNRSVLCEEGTNFHNYRLADHLEGCSFLLRRYMENLLLQNSLPSLTCICVSSLSFRCYHDDWTKYTQKRTVISYKTNVHIFHTWSQVLNVDYFSSTTHVPPLRGFSPHFWHILLDCQ